MSLAGGGRGLRQCELCFIFLKRVSAALCNSLSTVNNLVEKPHLWARDPGMEVLLWGLGVMRVIGVYMADVSS